MQGNTEQQQLILISQLCGSITTEVWPGVENLDLFNKMELPKGQKRKVNVRHKDQFSKDVQISYDYKYCYDFLLYLYR